MRRSGLTLQDAELIIQSVLRDDRAVLQSHLNAVRATTVRQGVTMIGGELSNWTLVQTRHEILNFFGQVSARDIPRTGMRIWPLLGGVPQHLADEAVSTVTSNTDLPNQTLASRGIVLHTVDREGRHVHVIDTTGNVPPPEESVEPETAGTSETSAEGDETEEPASEEAEATDSELDAPDAETVNHRRESLHLTDLHREILGANIRGRATLAKLKGALPHRNQKELRSALSQLKAYGYLE